MSMKFHRGGRQRGQPLVDGSAAQVLGDEGAPAIVVPTRLHPAGGEERRGVASGRATPDDDLVFPKVQVDVLPAHDDSVPVQVVEDAAMAPHPVIHPMHPGLPRAAWPA